MAGAGAAGTPGGRAIAMRFIATSCTMTESHAMKVETTIMAILTLDIAMAPANFEVEGALSFDGSLHSLVLNFFQDLLFRLGTLSDSVCLVYTHKCLKLFDIRLLLFVRLQLHSQLVIDCLDEGRIVSAILSDCTQIQPPDVGAHSIQEILRVRNDK